MYIFSPNGKNLGKKYPPLTRAVELTISEFPQRRLKKRLKEVGRSIRLFMQYYIYILDLITSTTSPPISLFNL